MPEPRSPASAVLEALGYALFRRGEDGSLCAIGRAPSWLRQLWPALDSEEAVFPTADASPFFENFLIDAQECWDAGSDFRVRSGPWIEEKPGGGQLELDATALTAGGQPMLLIERMGKEFAAKKEVLQKARETVLAHQRLNSEIQKKEILLHCVADEMTSALANIVTSLRLIEAEDNPPRTKRLIGFAMRGTEEQQRLINRVLEVFAEEIGNIYGSEKANGETAVWNSVLQRALDAAEPAFAEKRVRLVRPPADDGAVRISADEAHLERILEGLLENALQNTPSAKEVVVAFETEPESLLFRVTDSGPRMSAEAYEDVFARHELPPAGSDPSALRLHFCRIMIETSGGEIGCEPGEPAGNSFWFRLPRIVG